MKISRIQYIVYIFFICFLLPSKSSSETVIEKHRSNGISVVVIDPGHGGRDLGTTIGSTSEKDIVLDIALKLGQAIKTNYPDITVIYTRSKDIFIPLHERAKIANKAKANLFISIHANAVAQKWVQGTETFVLGHHRSEENLEVAKKENAVILLEDNFNVTYEGFDPNSPESYIMFELIQDEYLEQSVLFASDVQNQLKQHANRKDRSVRMAGFLVLRNTTMPGVLIETGFLSNAEERSFLSSTSGKTKVANSIFMAFEEYKNKIEDKSKINMVSDLSANEPDTQNQNNIPDVNSNKDIYFSVQVMALKKKLDIKPENFKGEKNIFVIESNDINRYYSGKFKTMDEAIKERTRLQGKYTSAYIVAIENNKLISIKKALEEM